MYLSHPMLMAIRVLRYKIVLAETEGFEPSRPFGLLVFKTSAFNRSATSPNAVVSSPGCHAARMERSMRPAWRRGEDSNLRAGKNPTYRISNPAPSASWVPLHGCGQST